MKQEWAQKFTEMRLDETNRHWANAHQTMYQLNELPPEISLQIIKNHWPQLASREKWKVLKHFFLTGHPRMLEILHWGITDDSEHVKQIAFDLISNIILDINLYAEFLADHEQYLKWYQQNKEKPLDAIIQASCRSLIANMKTAQRSDREKLAAQFYGDYINGHKIHWYLPTAFMNPDIRKIAIEEGILDIAADWLKNADDKCTKTVEAVVDIIRRFKPDHEYIAQNILPLTEEPYPTLVQQAAEKLLVLGDFNPEEILNRLVKQFIEGDLSNIPGYSIKLAEQNDPRVIPTLIGIMDADNTYCNTIYPIGVSPLQKLTGVKYSFFHDGPWWRRWWAENKSRYREEVQNIPIPDLPKTAAGKTYKPLPEELDTLDGKLHWIVKCFAEGKIDIVKELALEIGEIVDPQGIPQLIGIIDVDNSYDTIYYIGYYGLKKITGVKYSPFHDGPWWRRWWAKNKSHYPKDVQNIPIPELPKTTYGKSYTPFPAELDTLDGKLHWIVKWFEEGKIEYVQKLARQIRYHDESQAIPTLIGIIEADNTPDTIYWIGYFGLRGLTGVGYEKYQDGPWWRKWWEENKSRYPENVRNLQIPKLATPAKKQTPVASDVADIPAQDLNTQDDPDKRYFLIGPKGQAKAPQAGYRLLIVLPGGGGGADFHAFVKRVYKYALSDEYLAAQLVSKKWDEKQFEQLVWPTKTNSAPGMKFSTEEFIEAAIIDVQHEFKIDPRYIFTLSWSSGGPACYAASLQKQKSVTGTFIAMSVFKPNQYPPLENAAGHAYFILHSPEDFIPLDMALNAQEQLTQNGAKVELMTYPGGHGWRGDVYGNIKKGVQFLENAINSK